MQNTQQTNSRTQFAFLKNIFVFIYREHFEPVGLDFFVRVLKLLSFQSTD